MNSRKLKLGMKLFFVRTAKNMLLILVILGLILFHPGREAKCQAQQIYRKMANNTKTFCMATFHY